MPKHLLKLALLAFAALALPNAQAQSVTPVPSLDLARYTGTWYEIERIPNKPEKKCVRDAFLLLAKADKAKDFQIVNSCVTADGSTQVRNASARPAKKDATDGRIKITYTFPFSSKHWVLAVGPNYEWALVGSPNHKTLWILSRTTALPPDILADLKSRASAQGFDPAKLVPVLQPK